MKNRLKYSAIYLSLTLSACAGSMQGMVRGSGEQVTINFIESGLDQGWINMTLKDGETFKGKYINQNQSATGRAYSSGNSFSNMYGSDGISTGSSYGTGNATMRATAYSGITTATLLGDKGNSMRCTLQVSDPSLGLILGAIGSCNTSDGRVIDVVN